MSSLLSTVKRLSKLKILPYTISSVNAHTEQLTEKDGTPISGLLHVLMPLGWSKLRDDF